MPIARMYGFCLQIPDQWNPCASPAWYSRQPSHCSSSDVRRSKTVRLLKSACENDAIPEISRPRSRRPQNVFPQIQNDHRFSRSIIRGRPESAGTSVIDVPSSSAFREVKSGSSDIPDCFTSNAFTILQPKNGDRSQTNGVKRMNLKEFGGRRWSPRG